MEFCSLFDNGGVWPHCARFHSDHCSVVEDGRHQMPKPNAEGNGLAREAAVGLLINLGERGIGGRRVFPLPQAREFRVDYEWRAVPDWFQAEGGRW